MKKLKPKFILRSIPFVLLIIIGFSYYSCKKENHNITQEISDPAIAQAKSWYDITYPANVSSKSTTQKTNGITSTKFNFSQHISPNWKLAAKYSRFNKNVIEMPIDSTANFGYDLKNMTINKAYSNKKYNRSYFLLLNDGTNYQAYVMLIMADSTYVKNDLSKLNHNSYRKNDVDFTGMVLYFTPDGNYVNG